MRTETGPAAALAQLIEESDRLTPQEWSDAFEQARTLLPEGPLTAVSRALLAEPPEPEPATLALLAEEFTREPSLDAAVPLVTLEGPLADASRYFLDEELEDMDAPEPEPLRMLAEGFRREIPLAEAAAPAEQTPAPAREGVTAERAESAWNASKRRLWEALLASRYQAITAMAAALVLGIAVILVRTPATGPQFEPWLAENAARASGFVQAPPEASFGFTEQHKDTRESFLAGIAAANLQVLAGTDTPVAAEWARVLELHLSRLSIPADRAHQAATGITAAGATGSAEVARAIQGLIAGKGSVEAWNLGRWLQTVSFALAAYSAAPESGLDGTLLAEGDQFLPLLERLSAPDQARAYLRELTAAVRSAGIGPREADRLRRSATKLIASFGS